MPDLMQEFFLQGDLEGSAIKGLYPEGAQRYQTQGGVLGGCDSHCPQGLVETAELLHRDQGPSGLLQPENFCSGLSYSDVTEDGKTMLCFGLLRGQC